MNIDKDQIVQLLKQRGDHDKADQAQQDLPDQVDTDKHGDLLAKHGISVDELKNKLGGLGKLL